MSTFTEDVLLQISKVKHKKGEGILYITSERVAFILEGSETVSVSHPYTEIKTQKISSEFKSKVQLQVVFHDGSSSTFQFLKHDRQEALSDRDKAKDLLATLLPKFQKKVNNELQEKTRMLSENANLLQLYKELVISKVITTEEFWAQYAVSYFPQQNNMNLKSGVPGDFLVNIKPQTDGCNSVKYNLNNDTIECIFKTYPSVKKKHLENVPKKMSEADFWRKFFESHYFHKDRINADIFTECANHDDKEIERDTNESSITKFDKEADVIGGYGVLEEENGGVHSIQKNIIKRYNQHSIMVLNAQKDKNTTTTSVNGVTEPKTNEIELQLNLTKVESFANNSLKSKEDDRSKRIIKANSIKCNIYEEIEKWSSGTCSQPITPSSAVNALGELTPGGVLMKPEDSQRAQLLPPDIAQELQTIYMALGELLKQFWSSFPPTSVELEERAIKSHDALRRFHSVKVKPFEERILMHNSQLNNISSHLTLILNTAYSKFSSWHGRKKHL